MVIAIGKEKNKVMLFKTVKVYKCRNCGQEIRTKGFTVDFSNKGSFLYKAEEAMMLSNGCYAFFHECSEFQIGYCELIRREVQDEEIAEQKAKLEAQLADVKKLIKD